MQENYTDVSVVLDRSGSMASVRADTEGGFNTFVNEQKKVPGKCLFSLYQFDDVYETVYEGRDVKDVPKLDLQPRNSTALLDAIGKTINKTGERLRNLSESQRPSKVVILVQTDGEENASKEYSRDRIFEMIKHQREKYNWEFVFLGANQDAIATATSYGFSAKSSLTYAANSAGTSAVYGSLGKNLTKMRCCVTQDMAFDDEDKQNQQNAGV